MKKITMLCILLFSLTVFSQDEIPSILLETLDGNSVDIQAATNQDNIVVVSLWATWCIPCIKELDAIKKVYEEWQKETNVELIAVSVDDPRTARRIRPLINSKGWDYTILLDSNSELKRALKASTIPLTLLIKDNKIVYKHSGYTPNAEIELYEKIKEYSN